MCLALILNQHLWKSSLKSCFDLLEAKPKTHETTKPLKKLYNVFRLNKSIIKLCWRVALFFKTKTNTLKFQFCECCSSLSVHQLYIHIHFTYQPPTTFGRSWQLPFGVHQTSERDSRWTLPCTNQKVSKHISHCIRLLIIASFWSLGSMMIQPSTENKDKPTNPLDAQWPQFSS